MKNMTIADVAKHAQVSKSTVSQYLNKRYEYMSEATREKIEKTIKELNYRPNIVARSLKQKSTFTVGVIVANILHTFSTQIIRAIENNFQKQGFHIIVCNADDEPEKERNYIEMLMAKQVDGFIIFPTGGNVDLYKEMTIQNVPLVFMDRMIEEIDIPTVMLDNMDASRLAVTSLVEKGYERISIITTSIIRNISPRVERIQGYKKALENFQMPIVSDYIKSPDIDNLNLAINELFQLNAPPDSIIAGNDRVLLGVLNYIKQHELRIPEDIAVIGIDEVSFASFFTPTISTISQPTVEMANQAVKLLINQINQDQGADEKRIYRLKATLNSRESY